MILKSLYQDQGMTLRFFKIMNGIIKKKENTMTEFDKNFELVKF